MLNAHPEPDYVGVMVYMGEVVEDQPRAEGRVCRTVSEGWNGRLLMARPLIEPKDPYWFQFCYLTSMEGSRQELIG